MFNGKFIFSALILVFLFVVALWHMPDFILRGGELASHTFATSSLEVTAPENPSEKTYLVMRVIDGDTIEIEGEGRVRYIGINAPETVDPERRAECFGKEASVENNALVLGKRIIMTSDINDRDKYGRLLRYVFSDGRMVNAELVNGGFARAETNYPEVRYRNAFLDAEHSAKRNGLGLWSACPESL